MQVIYLNIREKIYFKIAHAFLNDACILKKKKKKKKKKMSLFNISLFIAFT